MRTFLIGILLGAAAGVLYAPATGNRTRSLLRDKMTKLSNDVPELIESKGRDLSNRLDGVKSNVNKAIEQARPHVEQAAGTVKDAAAKVRQDMMDARDTVMDQAEQVRNEIKQQRSA